MFCAPAVACEISAPPTTPRGTLRSVPGLTTLMPPEFRAQPLLARSDLDLQRPLGRRLVIDLECRVAHPEAFLHKLLQTAAQLVTVIACARDDMGRQGREARRDLPDVEIVNLHNPRLAR